VQATVRRAMPQFQDAIVLVEIVMEFGDLREDQFGSLVALNCTSVGSTAQYPLADQNHGAEYQLHYIVQEEQEVKWIAINVA
jgi:hypothetical protein